MAARVPKYGTIEEDERRIAIRLLLPAGRDQVLVLTKELEPASIETKKVADSLETHELLLALDRLLTNIQASEKSDRSEIDLRESKTTRVLFLDRPAVTDELGWIEER